ncbi:unnamed protein product, partial [Mesorhabditis belari]|uniref:Uncharacterized protein n=1 Tax=Mesorhabditis belari TaxID=2138241 RepID=A0AAF3E9J0_9BILA
MMTRSLQSHNHEYSKMYKVGGEKGKKRHKECKDCNNCKDCTAEKIEETGVKQIAVVVEEDDEERKRLERKKRTQEDMVNDFVKILEQMMKPRQAVLSLVSGAAGIASVGVSLIHWNDLPPEAELGRQLMHILFAYGVLQIVLATAFFVTCMQTSIAVSKGVKDAVQIVIGLIVALVYLLVALVSLAVGVVGFYKTISMLSGVVYDSPHDLFFCPKPLFYTSIFVFVLHIIMIVFKCCCCK